jgi:hypothetical protein
MESTKAGFRHKGGRFVTAVVGIGCGVGYYK